MTSEIEGITDRFTPDPSDPLAQEAFATIGLFVVRLGVLEAAMRSLVEALAKARTPESKLNAAKPGWGDLIDLLRKEAAQHSMGARIDKQLTSRRIDDITKVRHDVVHGVVDLTQLPGFVILRWHHNGRSEVLLGGVEQVAEVSELAHALGRDFRMLKQFVA